jgi:hypothetical protein
LVINGPTDHTTFTWDPVSAAWVHERGPRISPPPPPPDQHALQSYFFDADSKQWIRTVLAPLGRDLAAKWQGAHKIPEGQVALSINAAKARTKTAKKSSRFGVVVVAVALVLLVGGVGVFASQSRTLASANASKTPDVITGVTGVTGATGTSSTSGAPTSPAPAATEVVTEAPVVVRTAPPAPVVTRAPTPRPATPPPGPNATLPDGTSVVYLGPTSATRGGVLAARFTVTSANGAPAGGSLSIVLGDPSKDPKIVTGAPIDASGKVTLNIPITLPVGAYPLFISYGPSRAQLVTVAVR